MSRGRAAATLLSVVWAGGCVYLNSLYNARRSFDEGERARVEGRSAEAQAGYDDAIRKASASFRKDPEGGWADDALYLLGRAYLGRGSNARAVQAFEEAVARSDDSSLRSRARFRLGVALTRVGDRARALPLLDSAAIDPQLGDFVGEVRLERGRLLIAEGRDDEAAFDLVRAEELDPGLKLEVEFERLRWGIASDDTLRAIEASAALFEEPRAEAFADSLRVLARAAARRWGPEVAASLLAPVRTGDWPQQSRDQLLLQRIDLLAEAGDTLAVESEAGWAARGTTGGAEAARLVLARIRLRRTEDVAELDRVRVVLLPAGGNPEVAELVSDIRRVEALNEWGDLDDPIAWFVAAEMARDRLDAPRLARGLFLRFASEAPTSPWAGKAVLAALGTTPDPRSDPALRAGLETRAGDPYVARARSRSSTGPSLGELEARLDQIVLTLLSRADAEVERRDLFLRGADTLAPPSVDR